jgi:type IV pilus assembly protein PilC
LSVSQALAKYPKVFPEVYTQTLRAGEASGQFPEVSGRLADFLEKEVARKSQIASAMVYPIMLALTAVFVVNMLLFFVVPKMSGVFSSLGDDLPWNTKFLLGFSTTVVNNLTPILIALVAIIVGYRVWVATERGAYLRDKVLLRMPLVGKIATKAVISRYSRVLGTLVFGGVPILESLTIAGLSAGNRVFKETSEQVVLEVKEGKPIAQAMRDTAEFPPVLTHMVAIGEETGDLPKMLGRVSDSLDFEVDTGMRRLTSMVEPIIVLAMGAFVGFVVISILLPIFQAQDLVK